MPVATAATFLWPVSSNGEPVRRGQALVSAMTERLADHLDMLASPAELPITSQDSLDQEWWRGQVVDHFRQDLEDIFGAGLLPSGYSFVSRRDGRLVMAGDGEIALILEQARITEAPVA